MEVAVYSIEVKTQATRSSERRGFRPRSAKVMHAVYLDVKQYLANQRQGTHKSKERSEVSISYPQDRTISRRVAVPRNGDINSPVLVGGGRIFGPRPRTYEFKLNKKVTPRSQVSSVQ